MKKIALIFLILLFATISLAQTIITQLGMHPFYQPSLTSSDDVIKMVQNGKVSISEGFNIAGLPDVFDDFINLVPNAQINKVNINDGSHFKWMLSRENGQGPVRLVKDVTWISRESFKAFKFYIDSYGKRYNFIVPLICGNLALSSVTRAPEDWDESSTNWDETSKTWAGDMPITNSKRDIDNAENAATSASSTLRDSHDNNMGKNTDEMSTTTGAAIETSTNSSMDKAIDANRNDKSLADNNTNTSTDKADSMVEYEDKNNADESCMGSYCGKPGWKLGLTAGYPLGSAPDGENLNLGLLLGTPIGVRVGPLSVGLGAGVFTYTFDTYYFGGGLLASLCVNDLLNLDIPLIIQLHGIGLYLFGEDQGSAFGGIGSISIPLGDSPVNIGLYGGMGKYYPGDNDYNWGNAGVVLFYSF